MVPGDSAVRDGIDPMDSDMARRGTRGSNSKARRRSTSGRTTLSERLARLAPGPRTTAVLRAAAWFVAIGLVGWGIAAGVPELERRAAARDLDRTTTLEVVFLDEPTWFRTDPELVPHLAGTVQAAIGGERASTADRSGLIAARDALGLSGWFEQVRQVRWDGIGRVVVEADWVVPTVVVRARLDGSPMDVLVDRHGRRLPYAFEPGKSLAVPLLLDPARGEAPAVGESWGGDVEAGIALHDLLRGHQWYDQVRSVDLGNFRGDNGLVIRTDDCSIVWGLHPGTNSLAEPPARDKLRYLDALVSQYGRIDSHCLGGRISLPADVVTYTAAGPR